MFKVFKKALKIRNVCFFAMLIWIFSLSSSILASGSMFIANKENRAVDSHSNIVFKTKVKQSLNLSNTENYYPWSVLLYVGGTTKTQLGQIIRGKYDSAHETIYSAELSYALNQENLIRKIFQPIANVVEFGNNVAYRVEQGENANKYYEYDTYLMLRWTNFPWNKYVTTTFGAGEGLSYVNEIPRVEAEGNETSHDLRRLLNYLVFEATFAVPSHPEWQIVARIHHRSTAYGVFGNSNAGTNNVGLGLRYYFNI